MQTFGDDAVAAGSIPVNAKRAAGPSATDEALRETFAANLRAVREELGISQTTLATAAGISQKHLSAIETRSSNVSLDTMEALAKALGTTVQNLLTPKQRGRSRSE